MRCELCCQIRKLVDARIGFVVPAHYEERLEAALHRAARALGLTHPSAALSELNALPISAPAWQQMIGAVTIGETNFFRHAKWFAAIERQILAPLIEARSSGARRIDIWSAGCASGEEAFTLAMIVDRLVAEPRDWQIRILGTDINEASLTKARQAVYGRIRVSVIDHGAGIPRDFQARAFEAFARADSSSTREKGGTGLGLSIAKMIVEAHRHGRIGFTSEEGLGTTFYFELPIFAEKLERGAA